MQFTFYYLAIGFLVAIANFHQYRHTANPEETPELILGLAFLVVVIFWWVAVAIALVKLLGKALKVLLGQNSEG